MDRFSKLVQLSANKKVIRKIINTLYKCDISPSAKMGEVTFGHNGLGVVIGGETVIGNNVFIQHHVTMGVRWQGDKSPIIGDNVRIGAYSIILGPVKIGEGTVVGAGTIVTHDIPDNTIYYNHRECTLRSRTPDWKGNSYSNR